MKIRNILLKLYFLFRLPFIYLLKSLFKVSRNKPREIRKILIIRIDRMGDFILTLPVIDNLKLKYPRSEISIVVRPYLKELAGLAKNIDKIIIYENKISAIRAISKEKFDLAVDMLYDYRLDSAFLAFAGRAPFRAGFACGFKELLFNYSFKPPKNNDKDMAQLNLELLKLLDVPVTVTIPKLEFGPMPPRRQALGGQSADFIIALHPGGYYESQRWQAEKFILLSKNILDTYRVKLLIIGAAADEKLVNSIGSGINKDQMQAIITDMEDLVGLLLECKLLVCNNSGPLHLAAALGLPTVSTMGPTDSVLWQPKGENNIVIRKNLKCSPCSRGKCDTHECMALITVEEMFAAVRDILLKNYGIGEAGA